MPSYLALIIGLLPSFVLLFFFLREDEAHPEPKYLLIYAFLTGMATTFFVFGPQVYLAKVLEYISISATSILGLFLLAGLEEFFKFLGAYFTVARRKEFDEPIDAMIYMIVVSLGFAAMENIASAFKLSGVVIGIGEAGPLEVTALRFVGATLLHTLGSALVGYYWGTTMIQRQRNETRTPHHRAWIIAEGVGVATLLHTIFNYLIIKYESEMIVGPLFLVAIAFFVLNDFEKLKHEAQPQ